MSETQTEMRAHLTSVRTHKNSWAGGPAFYLIAECADCSWHVTAEWSATALDARIDHEHATVNSVPFGGVR